MNLIYKLIARMPSKQGEKALQDLLYVLSHGGIQIQARTVSDETGVYFVAESTNLSDKRIVTSGATLAELDENIKDAIFTVFQVPSRYAKSELIRSPLLRQEVLLQYATA